MQGRADLKSPDSDTPTNYLELRVLGLQRSGNHAVIEWILEQHSGKKACFLNNVRHGEHDPYVTARQSYSYGFGDDRNPVAVRSAPKHVLIYSYEDDHRQMQEGRNILASVYDEGFERAREQYLGRSKHRLDIIILRDPFNFFASRLKKHDSLPGVVRDLDVTRSNWKVLATHVLAEDANPMGNTLFVNYNRWFSDKQYRRDLSARLLGSFSDASLSAVSGFGGGSSFDSTDYSRLTWRAILRKWRKAFDPKAYTRLRKQWSRVVAPGAQNMKVLERWQELREDSTYRKIFADRELLELAQRLFGDLPGAREFGNPIRTR